MAQDQVIDRIVVRALPPLPMRACTGVLPDWAAPALRAPAQPWPENRNRCAVGVIDNTGAVGWFGPVSASVAAIAVDQIAPAVVGAEVSAWRVLTTITPQGRHRSGAHLRLAVSAVELAAWDLRSTTTGVRVTALLGGARRPTVPVYATALGVDIDHPLASDIAAWLAAEGFWAQKWGLPGFGRGEQPRADAIRLQRLRAAIGETARLCIDVGGQWPADYGRQMLSSLADCEVSWLEEPGALTATDLAAAGVVCAGGEHDYDTAEQLRTLTSGAVQVWQPDPTWNGGLAHSVAMVELAHLLGIRCFPHGSGLAVALQLAAASPPAAVPALEYHLGLEPLRQAVHATALIPVRGHLEVPTGPGLASPYRFDDEEQFRADGAA